MKKGKFYYCDNDECKKRLNKKRDYIQKPDPYIKLLYEKDVIKDLCQSCYYDSYLDT